MPWTKKFVQDNIAIIEKNHKLYPHRNKWDCDCHVTYEDDRDVYPINYDFLRTNYTAVCAKFALENNLTHVYLGEVWYSYYKEGQYQEPHVHESQWTAIHYLKYNRFKHSRTRFTDPKIKSPHVREGDIVIFPGTYEHYVKKNKSTTPRLTIAFGISIPFLKNDVWYIKSNDGEIKYALEH